MIRMARSNQDICVFVGNEGGEGALRRASIEGTRLARRDLPDSEKAIEFAME